MKNIDNKDFKFVVVGGGTQGWITALYMKKYFPNSDVTVIASKEIGILGAGEGTTPQILQFLRDVDIDFRRAIKHARATIKNGIRFTNWNGDGASYFHPFSQGVYDHFHIGDIEAGLSLIDLEQMKEGYNLDGVTLSCIASNQYKTTFVHDERVPLGLRDLASVALHFDATAMANFLEGVALSRNIKLVDDKVKTFHTNEQGDITSIVMENSLLNCDFVFDCSGFHRLIIGKFYGTKWNSYSNNLPVKKAIPFFIPIEENDPLPPYTEGIAMKYGWSWRIPVQGRYGCGYAFDSDLISADEAKKEIDEMLGYEVQSPREFNFNAGCFSKSWVNNCIAFGLGQGFIEPLEATAIWTGLNSLNLFMNYITGITLNDQKAKDRYNKEVVDGNFSIAEFLQYHYLTHRKDTIFWSEFRTRNTLTPLCQLMENELQNSIPNLDFFKTFHNWWAPENWQYLAAGLRNINPNVADKLYRSFIQGYRYNVFDKERTGFYEKLANAVGPLIDHKEFIRMAHETVR